MSEPVERRTSSEPSNAKLGEIDEKLWAARGEVDLLYARADADVAKAKERGIDLAENN
jgi:hypothetical protein